MLSGLNSDVQYQSKIYHVQTEDGGRSNPVIITLVYHGGAILKSFKNSFAEIANSKDLVAELKNRMNDQHKDIITKLRSGQLIPTKQESPQPTPKPIAQPSPPKTQAVKSLDDMILDYLSAKEERKK